MELRERLQRLLRKFLRIELPDGRVLVGCLLCVDRDCNTILGLCSEFRRKTVTGSDNSQSTQFVYVRQIPFGHVPGRHITSLHVMKEDSGILLEDA